MPALNLWRSILGGSDSSRMNRILTIEKELALSSSADLFGVSEFGFFLTEARMKPENAEETLEENLNIIYKLAEDPVSTTELNRAIADQKMSQLNMMRNNMRLARSVGTAIMETDGIEILDSYLDRLQKVTVEEIEDAVKRYFSEDAVSIAMLYPENWKGYSVGNSRQKMEAPGKAVAETLEQGQKFVFLEDHSLPLVHASLLFPGGPRFEDKKYAGVTELLSD